MEKVEKVNNSVQVRESIRLDSQPFPIDDIDMEIDDVYIKPIPTKVFTVSVKVMSVKDEGGICPKCTQYFPDLREHFCEINNK